MDHESSNQLHRAVHDKRPVPEIDFTLHTMEDGTQVSTQERVCKGNSGKPYCIADFQLNIQYRRPSACISPADRRPILFSS